MNKKILAAAIAASIAAPMAVAADVTVYGRAAISLVASDVPGANADTTDLVDDGSRLGFKGSEDLGNGLKANFQLEMEADFVNQEATALSSGSRNTYVGISGDFGEFRMGRHDGPAKMAASSLSTFHDQLGDVNSIADIQNAHFANAYAYISPNMSGFTVAGALVTGEDAASAASERDNFAIGYSLGMFYDNGPFSVRAYYENTDDLQTADATSGTAFVVTTGGNVVATTVTSLAQTGSADVWGIGARYKMDNMYVSAGYEWDESDTRNTAGATTSSDQEKWYIEGGYTMGNTTLKAIYGDVENETKANGVVNNAGSQDDSSWALGVDHNLSKRTMLWAQYADSDTTNTNGLSRIQRATAGSGSAWEIGMRHNF